MSKYLCIICVLLMAWACSNTQNKRDSGQTVSGNGHIAVENNRHNFGSIHDKGVVRTSFTLTNTGGSDIHIDEVKVSCGCVNAQLSASTIRPMESQDITVSVNTSNLHGTFSKALYIFSDADNEVLILRVSGAVVER